MSRGENVYTKMQANFALHFLRQTQKNELKSVIISPLMLSINLAIIYNGAAGETAKQIANIITGENSCLKLNKYFVNIWRQLQNQKSLLTISNGIYVKQNIGIYEKFLNISEKYFDTQVKSIDFCHPNNATKEINASIKAGTNDLFEEFIPGDIITPDINLMLINILNFHGEFSIHFSALGPYSVPEEFYVKDGIIRYVCVILKRLRGIKIEMKIIKTRLNAIFFYTGILITIFYHSSVDSLIYT